MALMQTYTHWPIEPVKAAGSRIWDRDGREYLDFTSGIGVVNVGHCHPHVVERVEKQLHTLWHVSNLFTIPAQELLARRLVQASGLGAAFFCNSGAEANEAAIKLVRKAAHETKGMTRPEIISFSQSFHGRTLATLTATGQDKVKNGFAPLPEGFVTTKWGDLQHLHNALTPQTAAVFLEVVQGEGGVRPVGADWLREVGQFCREHGLWLIVDEVQTGMGRTGKFFAHEWYGIKPDLITLAKGLGNGFPVGCLLATAEAAMHFTPGSHGSTFGGNPLAMEAGLAVLDVLQQPGFLDTVQEKGAQLKRSLSEQLGPSPLVKEIRGLGLMLGIVLHEPQVARLIPLIQRQGLLVLPAGPHVVRLLPPLTVSESEIEQAVDVLANVLAKSEADVLSHTFDE